jgi:hypothetical protein
MHFLNANSFDCSRNVICGMMEDNAQKSRVLPIMTERTEII